MAAFRRQRSHGLVGPAGQADEPPIHADYRPLPRTVEPFALAEDLREQLDLQLFRVNAVKIACQRASQILEWHRLVIRPSSEVIDCGLQQSLAQSMPSSRFPTLSNAT